MYIQFLQVKRSWVGGLFTVLPFALSAQTVCQMHPLIYPAKGEVLQESKPVLRWEGNPQANHRLQLVMHQPEGKQIHAMDTLVAGTEWTVPTSIKVPLVAVKVMVSSGCPSLDIQELLARPPSFYIQTPTTCDVESLHLQGAELNWRVKGPADSYRVELHGIRQSHVGSLEIGLPVARVLVFEQTQQTRWTIPRQVLESVASDESRVVSVQAQCHGQIGPARTLVIRSSP